MRILVVEDQVDFYEDYLLRLVQQLVSLEKVEIQHVPTLKEASELLTGSEWDLILMDFTLPGAVQLRGEKEEPFTVRNGADLISVRRAHEATSAAPRRAFILGMSSNYWGNEMLTQAGADASLSKLDGEDIAHLVAEKVKNG